MINKTIPEASPLLLAERHSYKERSPLDRLEFDVHGVANVPLSSEILEELEASYDDLPAGFAIIGGAARAVAFEGLGVHPNLRVRDIDIAAFFDDEGDPPSDYNKLRRDLTQKYMPDDARYGHGIRLEDRNEYFESRDFTINQLAVIRDESAGWRLEMTRQAVIDTVNTIVRPTIAVHDQRQDIIVNDKLAIKAVLLEQVLESEGLSPTIAGVDMRRYSKNQEVSAFHLGLGLQKAFEWGEEVPSRFFKALKRNGLIDSNIDDIEELVRFVQEDSDFEFRGVASEAIARAKNSSTRRLGDRGLRQTIGDIFRV